jgi:hypothetical protein
MARRAHVFQLRSELGVQAVGAEVVADHSIQFLDLPVGRTPSRLANQYRIQPLVVDDTAVVIAGRRSSRIRFYRILMR